VRQPGRHRFALTGPLTLAAMVLASALTLTHALPSYAVPASVEGDAVAVYNAETDKVQTLTVADAKAVTVSHDGYTVVAPPPPPPPSTQQLTGVSPAQAGPAGSGKFDVRWPFASPSPISSDFGPRKAPCGGCSSNHKGLDFNPGSGTQIQAIAGGIVRSAVSSNSGLGVHVVIEHEIDGVKVTSTYGHMLFGSLAVSEGQVIAAGDPVGRVGNTGASTGAHLHFEIAISGKQIDPYAWLKAFAG
jgi:murein DD-endopeptidase MepM/ murein hydrolase activator NlpD